MPRPNVLFIMTDQQRFDTIAALGNASIYTPNLDQLVSRGVAFTRAYTPCPVCLPARYTIRTGCVPPTTRAFGNRPPEPATGQAATLLERCGPYLGQLMRHRGYRTFGVGKFHTFPWDEDLGFDTHLHSEEMYPTVEQRRADAYAAFLEKNHPEFAHVEQFQGERTEMYYMPQTGALPPELTVESWAADQAVKQIQSNDTRPYYGFVSFIGPHPPFAPPVPFNRLYDPERMTDPIGGDPAVDHMDHQIPWMNHLVWSEDVDPVRARCCKARYYGEITYIDWCLGRILDAVDARPDADNTVICFFSDHGDLLGDHHGWQKECFFEASVRIPFLLSWPATLPGGVRRDELVGLEDLAAIATAAAGDMEKRDGHDVLGLLTGEVTPRDHYVSYHEIPGKPFFKIMVRRGDWKYIFMANGGREQLFNLADDPNELRQRLADEPAVAADLRRLAVNACHHPGGADALDGDRLRAFGFQDRGRRRINQMDASRGVTGFPKHPKDVLDKWEAARRGD